MRTRLSGVFPPIPTLFDQDTGDVSPAAVTANVRSLMETPLAGVLALGSNGEAPLLTEAESDRVVAAAREAVPADRVLLVGTGRESTRATVDASLRAAALGADAVMVRAPFFYGGQMSQAALLAHFRAVADASPVPVVLYNLPGVTGFSLTAGLVEQLAEHGNVAGLKETSTDLDRLGRFAVIRPDRFAVLSGSAPVLYPALCAGAVGGILAVANILPSACIAILEDVRAGRHESALALQRRLVLIAQLVSTVHGVAGLKAALEMIGQAGGPLRPPLRPLASEARDEIRGELTAFQAAFEARNADRALA